MSTCFLFPFNTKYESNFGLIKRPDKRVIRINTGYLVIKHVKSTAIAILRSIETPFQIMVSVTYKSFEKRDLLFQFNGGRWLGTEVTLSIKK
jgi:hypothetical protein